MFRPWNLAMLRRESPGLSVMSSDERFGNTSRPARLRDERLRPERSIEVTADFSAVLRKESLLVSNALTCARRVESGNVSEDM